MTEYIKNAVADIPDFRDRYYQPRLVSLKTTIPHAENLQVLNQGTEGACAGFGLAAVINKLYQERKDATRVSARMLYEMAKRYDEWPGEGYSGSSCRGAIRGWKNMGVCTEEAWKYSDEEAGYVTAERAVNARSQTLGAYYRLKHDIVDFHSAINEVGAVYVSARVHAGWDSVDSSSGVITPSSNLTGGHAFALVGYNERGFWVQNSWGEGWGKKGLGLWLYEDWAENVIDGWVIQLALSTPQIFDVRSPVQSASTTVERSRRVDRQEIAGHFIHLDDGGYHDKGRYFSNPDDVSEITKKIQETERYDHVVVYAHGGLNSTKASAKRVRAMKQVWLDNGIYPIHFMYDTGLLEEVKDILGGRKSRTEGRVGDAWDWSDLLFEKTTRRLGRALWREMKQGASSPFGENGDGVDFLKKLFGALSYADHGKKLHVVGHSNGANLVSHLVNRLKNTAGSPQIETCSLMAPASTVELFDTHLKPALAGGKIRGARIYNLTDRAERDDNVGGVYRKSLLYLVSRAFEEGDNPTELLGMAKYSKKLDVGQLPLKFSYTDGDDTSSKSHGGFDNDLATMNHVLERILGRAPTRKFKTSDLDY